MKKSKTKKEFKPAGKENVNENLLEVRSKNSTIWDEMQRMHNQMNSMMESFFESPSFRSPFWAQNVSRPRADTWETEKEVHAEIELPGMDKNDIRLNLSEGALEVRADKKSESKEEKKDFYRMERSSSHFYRSFSLPRNIDVTKANAKYENGVLRISIPKTKQVNVKSRVLEIK